VQPVIEPCIVFFKMCGDFESSATLVSIIIKSRGIILSLAKAILNSYVKYEAI
jgi:hypothetical protein